MRRPNVRHTSVCRSFATTHFLVNPSFTYWASRFLPKIRQTEVCRTFGLLVPAQLSPLKLSLRNRRFPTFTVNLEHAHPRRHTLTAKAIRDRLTDLVKVINSQR